MEKETYKKFFEEQVEKNFEKLNPLMEIETHLFFGVSQLMRQNFNCLMIDAHFASITLSNHILERLLKIALIYNDSLNEGEEASIKAYNRYQGMALRASITNCFNKKLIDLEEKQFMEDFINDMVRNGFSHSSFENVLGKNTHKIPAVMGNIYTSEIKDVEIDRRHLMAISELQMEQFAQKHAFGYYKYLHGLIEHLGNLIKPNEKTE